MPWFREFLFVAFLLVTDKTVSKEIKEKPVEVFKRTVETYKCTPGRYNEQSGDVKAKVIVETIKSISPSEYLTSSAFKVYEAPSSIQNSIASTGSESSNISPASVRITSVESETTLYPTYQINPHFSSISETFNLEKGLKIITTKGKIENGRYTLHKIIKKSTKIEPKIFESKPEETGFNGYHYDVGSLGGFETKHSGSQGGGGGGTMGASYMRYSSPFYNYQVMLD